MAALVLTDYLCRALGKDVRTWDEPRREMAEATGPEASRDKQKERIMAGGRKRKAGKGVKDEMAAVYHP